MKTFGLWFGFAIVIAIDIIQSYFKQNLPFSIEILKPCMILALFYSFKGEEAKK